MKQQKKSKFFTFIFSFIPGAAEMYMGFMRQGLSLMALFTVSIVGIASGIEILFIPAMILIWFYSFFHARNVAALSAEEFSNLPDVFLWEGLAEDGSFKISSPTIRKWAAGILMVIGAVILWDNFYYVVINIIPDRYWDELYPLLDSVPEVVMAVLIIFIGIKLMAGKKEELHGDER